MVVLGVEKFITTPPSWITGKKMAFLTHQAACGGSGSSSLALVMTRFPGQVQAVWSPQHGFYGVEQANMIPSGDFHDPVTKIPVFSLYGDQRQPTAEMFADIDLVLVDLVDVGCRVYTYIWTLVLVMEAAAAAGVPVLVLDRPNPLGGDLVEGNLLRPDYTSFVGLYPLPMRHGMTLGELARYVNDVHQLGCRLEVVSMSGWRRAQYGDETGLLWVPPSPNMPTQATALVYPGQVLLEGTNLSEGRGTTTPFKIWGAPFVEPERLLAAVDRRVLGGVCLRPTFFVPTFDKWQGQVCGGLYLHVLDRRSFEPYLLTLELLRVLLELYGDHFSWLPPPYEYEYEKLPIDILIGDPEIRRLLEAGEDVLTIKALWEEELAAFCRRRQEFLLY
ncbi:MAG: DUF1343 domain-containing protein [Deltaproteobacteria bacterium]|nr:DUF1343 domain-containing protein [Candidatus Anaeroferrophillus wilburensis]MBN2888164.1 DUF1343 domain-containing protein [Deltaproteobacteria bacterium]